VRSLVAVLMLCCSGSALQAQFARARVWLPGWPSQIAIDTLTTSVEDVAAPAGKVYRAAIAVFDELKIPADMKDSSARSMVANLAIVKTHALAGSQISRWFSCGDGMTGPNADSYRVTTALAVFIDAKDASTSRIRVGSAAGGQDMQGNAKDPIQCLSKGTLEVFIVQRIRARAATP
jgi:hypothetical protein